MKKKKIENKSFLIMKNPTNEKQVNRGELSIKNILGHQVQATQRFSYWNISHFLNSSRFQKTEYMLEIKVNSALAKIFS